MGSRARHLKDHLGADPPVLADCGGVDVQAACCRFSPKTPFGSGTPSCACRLSSQAACLASIERIDTG
jgi:hypothetical protein